MNRFIYIVLFLALTSCSTSKKIVSKNDSFNSNNKTITAKWIDKSRNRTIPVALFLPKKKKDLDNLPLVIFSHGYNENHPGAYLGYTFLHEELAQNGFFVASIQHELPTDELLPMIGDLQQVRMPCWERGAENILFVINQIKMKYPQLNFNKIIVMGHSNGGDMSTLFTKKYPELVYKLITLDQRRVSFPLVKSPKIYSLRSSDMSSSEGVIPNKEAQEELGITIVNLPNTNHNVMNDNGTVEQRNEMNQYILQFVKE